MRLTDILNTLDIDTASTFAGVDIAHVSFDSRKTQPGDLFVAIDGEASDGHRFINQAIANGAVAVLGQQPQSGLNLPSDIPYIQHPDTRAILSHLARIFYPEQPNFVAAVTGTSGKSSTVKITENLWRAMQLPAASLGTFGLSASNIDGLDVGSLTTPDPISLYKSVHQLKQSGHNLLALEASSHGLEQSRLDALNITAAAFTNLSQDHLDYHKDMEDYFQSKLKLFDLLEQGGWAILNTDCGPYSSRLIEACQANGHNILTYGREGDLKLLSTDDDFRTNTLRFSYLGTTYATTLPLAGPYQQWNALCALAFVMTSGQEIPDILQHFPSLPPIQGRMQPVIDVQGKRPHVFIDYAHKPEALQQTLLALRPNVSGKLWVVFGCGGDRDQSKRAVMGSIAQRYADVIIVTDDNPRTEDPAAIRAMVLSECPDGKEIGDRRAAIAHALTHSDPQKDIVLIAGKGDETYQIIGTTKHPFDDYAIAEAFLNDKGSE